MQGGKAILRTVSPKDTMMVSGQEEQYYIVGRTAMEICREILRGRQPKKIIDYPSGYGRAIRWFRAEWPEAEVIAVEIDLDALNFVAETFDAAPLIGDHHLNMVLPGGADLIFSGSLLTHLDDWQWDNYLTTCIDALAPDGTLVFTTHGRISALQARNKDPLFQGSDIDTRELYDLYEDTGFAFMPYSKDYPTFGLSLSSPEWVMRRLQKHSSIRIVAFEEGGWGQDVVAIRKNSFPMLPSDGKKTAAAADSPMPDEAASTVRQLEAELAEQRARCEALQQSTSWQLTAPLRATARLFQNRRNRTGPMWPFQSQGRRLREFYETVLKDHQQLVPIKTIADFEKTSVSYEQRIINENWTFDTKPRDADSGNEIAIDNLFVLKYLMLERRLSSYKGMDYWDFIRHVVNSRDYTRILSVGSGPCAVEMEIADKFTKPYVIDCLDLNENLVNAATQRARDRGINLNPVVADLNGIELKEKYTLVIICAALHHFVELEFVLQRLHDALDNDGLFVTYEPVMRSGMFLYPATRLFLGLLFLALPERLRVNHQDYPGEKRVDRYYREYDRSGWTFESIRSGEIPDLLPRYFKTVHSGRGATFLRRVSDSVYGANYRLDTRRDRILTDALCWLDRVFRATRLLKPEGLFYIGARKTPAA